MPKDGQCGWLMSLTSDSDWGIVDEFYDEFLSESDGREVFTVDAEVWGKLNRKEPVPAKGDGIGFYHSSRAQMPSPDPFGRKQRISLIGVIKGLSREGAQMSRLSVEIRRLDLERMRKAPIVRDQSTKHLFEQCGIGRGVPATFYYVPPEIWAQFKQLAGVSAPQSEPSAGESADTEITAFEGQMREAFVRHRVREASLRERKIASALAASPDARLRCEVPGCGFDFERVYGSLGHGFAEVHHLRPLFERDAPSVTRIEDLAVVCANCHRMIHRGGQSRSLSGLIRVGQK